MLPCAKMRSILGADQVLREVGATSLVDEDGMPDLCSTCVSKSIDSRLFRLNEDEDKTRIKAAIRELNIELGLGERG